MIVALGMTTSGMIHINTVRYMLQLINIKKDYEIKLLSIVSSTSAMLGMEKIMNEVLDSKYEYLFVLDSDIEPPYDVLDKLLSVKKDIVISPVWHYDRFKDEIHVNVHRSPNLSERVFRPENNGIEKILAGSISCALIHRSVLQKFRDRKESFQFWSPLLSEELKGSQGDNIFFAKAQLFGVETYVNWDIKGVRHVKQADLSTGILNKWLNNLKRG